MRRATLSAQRMALASRFQSTLSMRRATPRCHLTVKFRDIFQSTLSMRRATTNILPVWGYEGISIHALHEESDVCGNSLLNVMDISIHALHEESDVSGWNTLAVGSISIHALHEESDSRASKRVKPMIFQSTLSMRRATRARADPLLTAIFQSTLSMRRATVATFISLSTILNFNPRSP